MTRYCFHRLCFTLLLAGLFTTEIYGQPNNPKPSPKIIGTPFFPPSGHGPLNDTTLVSQYIRSIFQDSKGNLWFGPLNQGPIRYDGKMLRYFSGSEFYKGNPVFNPANGISVHAIAEDKKGNMWFGTSDGVVRYDGTTFRSYTQDHGLSNINVGRKCILVDRLGEIWVGTSGGVFQYNASSDKPGGKAFSQFPLMGSITIRDILEDNNGNIWFASAENGVFRYDGKEVKNIKYKEALGDNYAGGMMQDKKGNFWFLTKDGICRYDGTNFIEITSKDGLGGTEFWGICQEKSGIIWVTARGNTTRYDPSIPISNPKAFTVFTPKEELNCCVQSMYLDKQGNMWWGTGQGLYRFDGKQFYQVKQKGPW